MTFIDHLKGQNGAGLYLEVAFGYHIIAGDLAKSIVTGSSPTHVVTVQQLLGDAFGKGWGGPLGVWFRGINRPASTYKFHKGLFTPDPVLKTYTADSSTDVITSNAHGFANGDMVILRPGDVPEPLVANKIYWVRDQTTNTFKLAAASGGSAINLTDNGSGTLQLHKNPVDNGIDPVFDQDVTHSNVAWTRLVCPNGSEVGIPDANTRDFPPLGHSGVYACQLGDIYDDEGNITSSGVLLTNPADVLAFGCMVIRKYPLDRIDWTSISDLRDHCDVLFTPDYTTLPQGVGVTGSYFDGTNFNTFRSKRVDPVIQFDSSSGAPALDLNPDAFSARFEAKIRPKYTETYTFWLTGDNGRRLWVGDLVTPLINQWADDGSQTPGTNSATIALTADQFYDLKVEWNEGGSVAELKLEWQSTSQPRQVVPQDRLYPKNEQRKRYECHVAFTQPTTFDDFLRTVLFQCNGTFQDIDGRLTFFTLDDRPVQFDFDESNIVKNSLKYYPRFSQQDLLALPNRYIASGRDIDTRYLEPFDPPLEFEIPSLQDQAGRIIEETVNVGSTNRIQAMANIAHFAAIRTAPMVAELEGMPQTFKVLQGDVVRITDTISGWVNKRFLVIEATDKATNTAPDNRFFRMIDWP